MMLVFVLHQPKILLFWKNDREMEIGVANDDSEHFI